MLSYLSIIDNQMYIIVGVLVAALVFSFIAGVTVLYCLRQRKRKKEKLRGRICKHM